MSENSKEKQVWIIGHKNPDTDAVCAALAYAALKNLSENTNRYVAMRAGEINAETRYVLSHFGVSIPERVWDVGAQIKDIEYRKTDGVSSHISIRKAWRLMKELAVVSLPVVKADGRLDGLVVTSDIADSYMDMSDSSVLAVARTQIKNIAETLDGKVIIGNEHSYITKGKVVIGASASDTMRENINSDDIVIVSDRVEAQMTAIEENASCLIICTTSYVEKRVIDAAKERDCIVISTPHDAFTTARLIYQSMPIKHIMKKDHLITFSPEDYADDVKEEMGKVRHRDFPVVTDDGRYVGMISRRNLLKVDKKQVILVDHNEKTQAVDGIEGAEILEIIDHHRLRSLETISPVFFRNMPLGSTSTIIYLIFKEKEIEIPKQIAGILLAAIISDTLMFRSPTSTKTDEEAGKELAKIAGEDIEKLADAMFEAGSDFKQKSIDEIFNQDFKTFDADGLKFGVSQISSMNNNAFTPIIGGMREYLQKVCKNMRLDMAFVMLTDIPSKSTLLLYSGDMSERVISLGMGVSPCDNAFKLSDVVSRKKQLIPGIISGISAVKNS